MNFAQLDLLLGDIARVNNGDGFVVVGGLCVLGLLQGRAIPPEMLLPNKVSAYVEQDPERGIEIHARWGQGSVFEREHGYYFNPVSPKLPTLPDGWQSRMIPLTLPSGVSVKFLEPNDAAVSKYARGEAKDHVWIREGLRQSLLSLASIEYRFRETPFLDRAEIARATTALLADQQWLETLNRR